MIIVDTFFNFTGLKKTSLMVLTAYAKNKNLIFKHIRKIYNLIQEKSNLIYFQIKNDNSNGDFKT